MHYWKKLLFLLFAAATIGLAGTTGKISGTVKDAQTGEPAIGASIMVEGTKLGAAADVNGFYTILNVPPGTYTVSASAVGYAKAVTTNISVSIDLNTKQDFSLKTESVNVEEVVITAAKPIVQKDLTSVEAHVDAEQIKNIPVTEVKDVITLQSGVTVDGGGGLHIRGGRSSEIAYWVDGRPVTDVYDNSSSLQLSNSSVQELQVISGTFNAEYGDAMSGIINIVTKDGGSQYKGNIAMYGGDYVSDHSDIFPNITSIDPVAIRNVEASLSGPLPVGGDLFKFYTNGRYYNNDGYLYGTEEFTPNRTFTAANRADSGQYVGMNWNDLGSGQVKLTYQPSALFKLNIGGIGDEKNYRGYNHEYELNPTGDVTQHERAYDLSGQITHTLSSSAFYTLSAARTYHGYYSWLYDDPTDPRYVDPDSLNTQAYEFYHAGTNNSRYERNTTVYDYKGDFTDQLNEVHQLKFGAESRLSHLYAQSISLVPLLNSFGQQVQPYQAAVDGDTSQTTSDYTRQPIELSGYVQDKIEYQSVIINVGLRYDYFNSRANVPADPEDPNIFNPLDLLHKYNDLNHNGVIDPNEEVTSNQTTLAQREAYWWRPASAKSQLSPRIGIAYPITDRGVIHFSYGHFLQVPSFTNLFDQSDFKVPGTDGMYGVYGNPDLKPQSTVMYELGLQQQIAEDIGIDFTGFYRDVRNWVTASPLIQTAVPTVFYSEYINKDYENVRGVTITMAKRQSDYWSFNLSYTYEVAEGTNSNPADAYNSQIANVSPVEILIPMDWDQTHTVNATLGLGDTRTGVYFIGKFLSGQPYTPEFLTSTGTGSTANTNILTNSSNKPNQEDVDLRAFKVVNIAGADVTFSLKVYNLFDTENAVNVYADTGLPNSTQAIAAIAPSATRVNSTAQYINDPSFYSPPREVDFGIEFGF
jgi:outer membrane receptor for ferrienterochelin and colicin